MSSESESENYIPPDMDNLITKIGEISIDDNFINIKPEIKQEDWNPNVNEIPSTSKQIPIRNQFDKPNKSYAALSSAVRKNENYTPYEKMMNEPINPFGIYLDLDCISNTEEAIDKWETLLEYLLK